ncbi:MAG: NAD(P)H quinone oxidoreductase [Alphaproteobacteria bacterium]|nr:MAG: NAD(P)H quinone oxidoreductase [Alphaproteobacteria bacterium]
MERPETMEAIAISRPGGPEVLVVEERPVPRPREGEVLVRVAAAGVNRPDCLQRQGAYPPPPGAPDIPGLEIAGEVAAAGAGVDAAAVGRRVMALVPGGGYAQWCVAHLSNTLPIPAGLSMAEAAAVPETFFTVWHNVFQRGRLTAGETFLVHGGTSGIGTTAIQLAKAFGATVIATAGSPAKCRACLDLGADQAINYRTEDFVAASHDFTGGRGVDLILDMVGGAYIERNWDAAAPDGRIVQIAFLAGPRAEANFAKLMTKRLTHTGSTLRPRPVEFKAGIAAELEARVWPLVEAGRVRPVMDSTFPLAEAAAAHARMEEGRHIGKIVLAVD